MQRRKTLKKALQRRGKIQRALQPMPGMPQRMKLPTFGIKQVTQSIERALRAIKDLTEFFGDRGTKGHEGQRDTRDKGTRGTRDKGTKGQRDKGTKGQRDKGTKGQRDKGTKGQGTKGQRDNREGLRMRITTRVVRQGAKGGKGFKLRFAFLPSRPSGRRGRPGFAASFGGSFCEFFSSK